MYKFNIGDVVIEKRASSLYGEIISRGIIQGEPVYKIKFEAIGCDQDSGFYIYNDAVTRTELDVLKMQTCEVTENERT